MSGTVRNCMNRIKWEPIVSALKILAVCTLVCGVVYPLTVLAAGQLFFKDASSGSLIETESGMQSRLAGQTFTGPQYLQGRLQKQKAAQDENGDWYVYGVPASEDVQSETYQRELARRIEAMKQANPDAIGDVPQELVTWSASGSDPQISKEAALWQIPRIARARSISEENVRAIIEQHTSHSMLSGDLVSVLEVNLALDALQ